MQWLANICVRRPVFAHRADRWSSSSSARSATSASASTSSRRSTSRWSRSSRRIRAPRRRRSRPTSPQKIEEAVNTISGLDKLTSVSTEGVSLVIAQFDARDRTRQGARRTSTSSIATVLRDLPPGTRPEVRKADPDAAPVLVLAVKGPAGLPTRELTRFADKQVKQRIERLNGVGQVVILGGQERQINVKLDPIRLAAAGVSALEVQRAIATATSTSPAAASRPARRTSTLRIEGRADRRRRRSATSSCASRASTRSASRDVADRRSTPRRTPRPPPSRNGVPAIALSVRKQSGTNTVAVVDRVKAARRRAAADAAAPATRSTSCATTPSRSAPSASQVLEHLVRRRAARRARRAAVPRQPALDDHRGDLDPGLDHRRRSA